MKILQINSNSGVGSTGKIVIEINKVLDKSGDTGFVGYGRDSKEYENNIKIGSKADIYRHLLATRLFDRHGLSSKEATKRFTQKVQELEPDIIHLHNIHGYYLNYKVLFDFLREVKIPVVWTLHDCWAFTGHCAYFDYANCTKWKSGCYNCPETRSYPKSLFIDNSKQNYIKKKNSFTNINNLTIITPSNWLKNLVKYSFLKEYDVKVINNGIDLDIFQNRKSDFRLNYNLENKFLILGVANVWDRRKGLNYFIELSKLLNENERIVLVGLEAKMIKSLPNNIIGIQKTRNAVELAEIYSTCDVFINPTLEDNFPTTNLESIACGTPVITFKTGGSSESIDEKTGIVVERKDTHSIREAINQMNNNNINYALNCRKAACEKFDMNDKFLEYYNVYQELIKN